MKKHLLLYFLTFLSAVGGLYCCLGAIMAMWLSATPNYPKEQAASQFNYWLIGIALSFFVFIFCVVKIKKIKRK